MWKEDTMRAVAILALVTSAVFVLTLVPADGSRQSRQGVTTATGLILQKGEGERRVRRPRPDTAGRLAAAGMIIKVDEKNGGSPDFFMAAEDIVPGDAIAPHSHPGYDEILFVHRGTGLATLGSQQATVSEGATIYIPSNTRVSLKNTGIEPLSIVFIFPRPQTVSA
jgi:mannose-6-phosphate isomerase-like protein (cupin superfamily)